MTTFLTWSFPVLPLIHRSILISATGNLFSSLFLTTEHCSIICHCWLDHYTVLYTLSFSLMCTFFSHSTPVSCFHCIQASLTRLLVSLSAPPFESNIDLKYLNVVTADSQSMSFELVSPYLQFSLSTDVSHRTRSSANGMA